MKKNGSSVQPKEDLYIYGFAFSVSQIFLFSLFLSPSQGSSFSFYIYPKIIFILNLEGWDCIF